MSKIFIVMLMMFCHIADDYYLQGWLAAAKQKSWWGENAPQELYKHDYIMALAMHSMSWSFMIMLPIAVYYSFNVGVWYLGAFLINAYIHMFVDNAKANWKRINLVIDQSIHIFQILITAAVFLGNW